MQIDWTQPTVRLIKTEDGYNASFAFSEAFYQEYLRHVSWLKILLQSEK